MEQLVSWGKEVAAMLAHIHERGLIYRDLKASNVIVAPDGQLRLIDFDVSMEYPSMRAYYSPGTLGYMSRQQNANEAPRVEHDIYSLGALLYFMATGADPSRFSRPYDLLNRPAQWLNSELGDIAEIIGRCLAPQPEDRFGSMQEVIRALNGLTDEGRRTKDERNLPSSFVLRPSSTAPASRPSGLRPVATPYLKIARQLGDTLCMTAVADPGGNGCYWLNPRYSEMPVVARDLATGSAGPLLVLAELMAELGEDEYRQYLRDGARWLAAQSPQSVDPRPGLYNGEGGVSIALLRAGQVLKDDTLVEEAARRAMWVSTIPFATPGIFNGTAGRVRFHLLLWDATGDEMHLNAAIEAADVLVASAQHEGTRAGVEMLSWAMPPGDPPHGGRTYTGYALGAAGVGDAMLDLFDVTGELGYLQVAHAAARWLESLAEPALNDGSGVDWPQVEGEPLKGAFWGHGASGVGISLLNALKHGLISKSDRLLERACLSAAYGTRWGGPTLAYGLGGPIEFLLDAYQETSNAAYLRGAEELAAILGSFAVEIDGSILWPSEDPTLFTPDFIVGYSGIAIVMLRLAFPRHIPRVATLAASRRNRLQAVHRTPLWSR